MQRATGLCFVRGQIRWLPREGNLLNDSAGGSGGSATSLLGRGESLAREPLRRLKKRERCSTALPVLAEPLRPVFPRLLLRGRTATPSSAGLIASDLPGTSRRFFKPLLRVVTDVTRFRFKARSGPRLPLQVFPSGRIRPRLCKAGPRPRRADPPPPPPPPPPFSCAPPGGAAPCAAPGGGGAARPAPPRRRLARPAAPPRAAAAPHPHFPHGFAGLGLQAGRPRSGATRLAVRTMLVAVVFRTGGGGRRRGGWGGCGISGDARVSQITSEGADLAVHRDRFIDFALLGRATRRHLREEV